jgi:hypothetical protein
VKSGFFFASKRNEIFASISNFASEAKVRAHPNDDQSFRIEKYFPGLKINRRISEKEIYEVDSRKDKYIPR